MERTLQPTKQRVGEEEVEDLKWSMTSFRSQQSSPILRLDLDTTQMDERELKLKVFASSLKSLHQSFSSLKMMRILNIRPYVKPQSSVDLKLSVV